MTTIDRDKPIWRVVGRLPAPDGRRMTIFCNATSEEEAKAVGFQEGMDTFEYAKLITPEQIAEWERMYSKVQR